MNEASHILIVDDQEDFAEGLKRLVGGRFPEIKAETAFCGDEALEKLQELPVCMMITDLRMPAMNGLELMEKALELHPELSVVLLTAHGSIETAVAALKSGAYDFLTKPVEPEDLFRVVAKGLERSRLIDENRRLKSLLARPKNTLLGEGRTMQRLRQSIAAVAAVDYTVLITGESGTGKELAARMVHEMSPRTDKPFVAVNCPAVPVELLESELFGHVRGAFTGAEKDREGLFAKAHKGTLLLDEIGDVPLETQRKLLRVLQEGEIRQVGSDTSRKVDVRVLASTNKNLLDAIADKTFREDLYYRLNVLNLTMPPLRERVEDIPLLARFFLHQACREMRLPEKNLTEDVAAYLSERSWSGNVRELQNFLRKLAVFGTGDTVTMSAVRLAGEGQVPAAFGEETDEIPPYKDAKAKVLDGFTREYIREALQHTGGNVSQAARLSGLSRPAVQNIMQRFDIAGDDFKKN